MALKEQSGRLRRVLSWVPEVLLVAAVAFSLVAAHLHLGARWGLEGPDPAKQPALVLPPEGLDLRLDQTVAPVATPASGPPGDPTAIRQALAPRLNAPALGKRVGVVVTDLSTGAVLWRTGPTTVTPASTMKLLTSVAALDVFGPEQRFSTAVVRTGARLTLVGGGDPLLTGRRTRGYPQRASLAELADKVAAAIHRRWVRLDYDASLFSGPRINPAWPSGYVPDDVVPPITALWDDEGHAPGGGFVADPARDAATDFAALLAKRGLKVRGQIRAHAAPTEADPIAVVKSPPLSDIVSHLLAVSDNNAAEVVAHHVGQGVGGEGSFRGGAAGVRTVLARLGVPMAGARIVDGSGLARVDRLDPATLAAVLHIAAAEDHPRLRSVITGMPVAGYSGSLTWRFDRGDPAGRGRVQAKTGTLTGVHGLAGVATDVAGTSFGFVIIADRVPAAKQLTARIRIDQAAAALAACSCGAP